MRAIDQLSQAVDNTVKTESGKVMTKDNLVDLISNNISALRNVTQFFAGTAENNAKLKGYIDGHLRDTQFKSIVVYNSMLGGLSGLAKKSMEGSFLGAISETASSMSLIMEEFSDNINKVFTDKQITIYNTKVSQAAAFGMIESASKFAVFASNYISLFMADKCPALPKPAPYVTKEIDADLQVAIDTMNRTINNRLAKNFVASIVKYRNGGADMNVVGQDNQSAVHFAKVNSEVTEADIKNASSGLKIFKIIGDWFVDRQDRKLRLLRVERDQITARCQLLQLELNGYDPESPEYKRQVKIIENYQKLIDRLNQEIAKKEQSV